MMEFHCIFFFQAGNLPWLEPVVKQFTKGTSYQKAINVLANATITVIHERRKEKSKSKVVHSYYAPFFTVVHYTIGFASSDD